ncbi:conserved Plasmodium membrane protein, unknown function [Plasmodium knowlesi strain H]|uniref:Uncharacterized protein n=3 Tax=Plasmodium knowlesi TaxID=5850 RepID=A0A5E7WV95_PLAKH|nr:conserved Plasmodium membrane protein, unknown function [Plasmodium knowlesi strain H]OTN68566.1 Uncharacterized protein PKNOH_S02306400 [Plasmodium knowlesi]CAA9986565.1 conserved Plasmodium membrane protein, unknown function [Plasmodium knowlesi strain H]SBO24165.1 conserved Plasmodium membrane protein, unknown function [Plasmodium knowlesi strain H]SBO29810.1 conserved Plasmodium membrane protein, unknown function [Plasmodium knowlesi strain H]VVS76039.1 conserved Plasmodium membrane pro
MFHHFRGRNALHNYLSRCACGKFPPGVIPYRNRWPKVRSLTVLETLRRPHSGYSRRGDPSHTTKHRRDCKGGKADSFKEKHERDGWSERSEKINTEMSLYYPESNSFPFVTTGILLGMVGISSFFQFLIYTLKFCEDESSILLKVNEFLDHLDAYFIIHDFEGGPGEGHSTRGRDAVKSGLFSIKYLTSPFFANENILQCAVQLSTFFLASRFLEKQFGSLKFGALFISASILSNLLTHNFLKYLTNQVESLNSLNFVLIHPSGSMAFICALCSICFKNCAIWKDIPVHCSILVVPYLLSSFYGLLSLYKIGKNTLENTHGEVAPSERNSLQSVDAKDHPYEDPPHLGMPHTTRSSHANDITNPLHSSDKEQPNAPPSNKHVQNETMEILRNFLIVKACDEVIKRRKKENMFPNKKIQNLKNESLKNINEINNRSKKIFFGLSSSFTDICGILLASCGSFLFKMLR